MNNAKSPPLASVDISLFGGLYTEANPADLPEGASPQTVNCDYIVGTVKQRPGKRNRYYYADFFSEKITGNGSSQAGAHAPNEVPWTNPNNASLNTVGSYAEAILNTAVPTVNGIIGFDKSDVGGGTGTAVTTPSVVPAQATEWALFDVGYGISAGSITPNGSWLKYNIDRVMSQIVSAAIAGDATLAFSQQWASAIALFTLAGTSQPTYIQSAGPSGAMAAPFNITLPNPVVAGNTILVFFEIGNQSGSPTSWTPRIGGVAGQLIATKLNGIAEMHIWAFFNVAGGPTTINVTGNDAIAAATQSVAIEVQGGRFAPPTAGFSQELRCVNFPFSIPSTVKVLGFQVEISGRQSSLASDALLTVSLINPATNSPSFTKQLTPTTTTTQTVSVNDNFDRADGGLGANWFTAAELSAGPNTNLQISGNGVLASGVNAVSYSAWKTTTFPPDQTAEVKIVTLASANAFIIPSVRIKTINQDRTMYQVAIPGPIGAVTGTLRRAVAGVFTTIATFPITTAVNDVIRLEVTGSTLTVKQNGIVRATAVDTNITAGQPGFEVFVGAGAVGDAKLDDFTATFVQQVSGGDGTVTIATPTEKWGLALTPDTFNNPNFGVKIVASATSAVTFDIYAVKIKVWLTPDPPPSINYLKTFSQTGGELFMLALGSDGIIYREDAINDPGVLRAVFTGIEPASFAESATQADREFIAISNLRNGTHIPLTYHGTNFDRLSQIGPGAPPSCSASATGSTILSITQNPPFAVPSGDNNDHILVSDSPSSSGDFGTPATPGNVMSLYFHSGASVPSFIKAGTNIVLSGFPLINGNVVNNDPSGVAAPKFYTVTSVGQSIPGQQGFAAIVFTVRFTTFFNTVTPAGLTVRSTTSTMTTAQQVSNLEVGGNFQISGTGGAPPTGYDNTWLVTATPNAAQLQIASTSLVGNIATYAFNLITGSSPTVGQFITVTQCLNGNGVFNVVNAVISAVTASTFSINIVAANVSSAPENGAGIILGTIFQFDAFTVIPNVATGTVTTSGVIGAGRRKCCYSFLTRNGYITQPSPINTFTVASGATAIVVANLATGPSNVIARIIHFTAADGGNFYNIPKPVTVNENGVDVVNASTWVNDNTTTNVLLSFSDGVLLAATPIDVQGNNLFETAELGSIVGLIPYAGRVFAIAEQNKVTNLLNWSFDGGIGIIQGTIGGIVTTNAKYPLGWTVDRTFGSGGSVVASSIFGNAYAITNSTGVTQAKYGMITQPAFEDEFGVPIIFASTTYSVRVTVSVPTGATTGNLVVDLYSPSSGLAIGTFTLNLATVPTTMRIFSGTLLTAALAPVPRDLILRVYASSILNGAQIQIDRVEVFPTEEPNLNLQVTGSYVRNFEAFDQLTGVINGSLQNQQPVRSAFTLFDSLYLVKQSSIISTQDNGTTEPSGWSTRVVSNSVGTPSIYGVTTGIDEPNAGEEWAIIAGESGAYIFYGAQPIKLTEEIQSLWNQINWAYGHTLWVKNDIVNRRILFGVPLKTPNDWLPTGIIPNDSNPTTPNVVLALSYKQLPTAGSLAERVGVHPSYSGRLIATEYTRKWSIWTIKAPCAAFITRSDTTTPLFLGNSDNTGKIYDLVPDLLQDDGASIDQRYFTYGFVSTDQEQAMNLGSVRKMYEYMTLLLDGAGALQITVYPNTLDGPYSHDLLPNITLPGSNNGDTELPVNEVGSRLFVRFRTNAVGQGFELSKMMLAVRQDPWSPVRGRN